MPPVPLARRVPKCPIPVDTSHFQLLFACQPTKHLVAFDHMPQDTGWDDTTCNKVITMIQKEEIVTSNSFYPFIIGANAHHDVNGYVYMRALRNVAIAWRELTSSKLGTAIDAQTVLAAIEHARELKIEPLFPVPGIMNSIQNQLDMFSKCATQVNIIASNETWENLPDGCLSYHGIVDNDIVITEACLAHVAQNLTELKAKYSLQLHANTIAWKQLAPQKLSRFSAVISELNQYNQAAEDTGTIIEIDDSPPKQVRAWVEEI